MKKVFIICLFLISCQEAPQKIKAGKYTRQKAKVLENYTDIAESEISRKKFDMGVLTFHNPIILDSSVFAPVNGKTTLPVKAGDKVFVDNRGVPHDEDMVSYRYRGRFGSLNSYVVEVHLYEDDFFLLINAVTGRQDTLNGFPFLSPDKRKIFCSRYNPYETYEKVPPPTCDVEIHLLKGTTISQIIRKPLKNDIMQAYWKNSNTIYTKVASGQGGSDSSYRELRLTEKRPDGGKQ
ncbi:hypothetical protein [Pedobacter zeae]|uniref:Uncharacterized protein n=1 Tax=Pedobacter zeae TaxID=1737356 RepID=A0A7W6P490_9SPHI|nr:hypothetical protein [Pedobacter zeae]MBB4106702.1 hypothetical protein [Pedobacter zeae]GGH03233.1 hypothetical protein GCM10007422_18150 [Pedobacter zeae]